MRHVVYLTDENYAMPTCISIVSLICNNTSKANYKVHIIANNVTTHALEIFSSLGDEYVTCDIIEVTNERYKEVAQSCLSKGIHVSDTALFKFDIATLLSNVDKVLYLDSDIIVNKDLSELFSLNISDSYLAAVDDMGDNLTKDGKSFLSDRIGITNRRYFNSGVMYLNLDMMRQNHVGEKLLRYRIEKPNFFMDQDSLNAVLGEKRVDLPYTFNFRTALLDVMQLEEINNKFYQRKYKSIEECLLDQTIIHMTDKHKPWEYNVPWITDLFLKYYKLSDYKENDILLNSYVYEKICSYKGAAEGFMRLKAENQLKVWPFPFDKVTRDSKIILYGAGNVGQDMYKQIMQTGYCELVLWVDKNWEKFDEDIANPELILSVEYDAIVIAIANNDVAQSIKEWLVLKGIERDKIIYE